MKSEAADDNGYEKNFPASKKGMLSIIGTA